MKDASVYLRHIVESAEIIASHIEGLTKKDFLHSVKTQDAVIRRLQILGEATKHLSEEMRSREPNLPWRQITGMRDVLIHEYFDVDMGFVWKTVSKDVPELAKRVRLLLD